MKATKMKYYVSYEVTKSKVKKNPYSPCVFKGDKIYYISNDKVEILHSEENNKTTNIVDYLESYHFQLNDDNASNFNVRRDKNSRMRLDASDAGGGQLYEVSSYVQDVDDIQQDNEDIIFEIETRYSIGDVVYYRIYETDEEKASGKAKRTNKGEIKYLLVDKDKLKYIIETSDNKLESRIFEEIGYTSREALAPKFICQTYV